MLKRKREKNDVRKTVGGFIIHVNVLLPVGKDAVRGSSQRPVTCVRVGEPQANKTQSHISAGSSSNRLGLTNWT